MELWHVNWFRIIIAIPITRTSEISEEDALRPFPFSTIYGGVPQKKRNLEDLLGPRWHVIHRLRRQCATSRRCVMHGYRKREKEREKDGMREGGKGEREREGDGDVDRE